MNLPAYSRYDWLLQLIILPLYIGLINWILIGDEYWHNRIPFILATLIALAISFQNWYVNNYLALKVNYLHPDPKQYVTRAFRRFLVTTVSSCLHVVLMFGIYWLISLPGFEPSVIRLCLGLLYTTIIVAIVVVTYESMDSFGHWQRTRQEVDTLSKAQLQAQFEALQQQVNPHFLFNSLNSLISLIDEDPRQAREFAEELSTVYRYLLRSNESPLVPLSTELDFVQSYFHLLRTRHGSSLTLTTQIQPGLEDRRLPPLTLQLLLENAVKHNVILPDQPLTIALCTDEQQRLIVSNNLQRKPSRAFSNGVGLSNILTKYQMLGQPVPTIEDDGREFRVTLPLV